VHLSLWHVAMGLEDTEQSGRLPRGAVQHGVRVRGQGARQVRGQPTARDVSERTDPAGLDEGQAVLGVDARRGEELLAQGSAELRQIRVEAQVRRGQNVPDERVPVRVDTGRGYGDDRVAGPDAVGAEDLVRLDDARLRAREVELILLQQA